MPVADNNPLGMRPLTQGGPFVLAPMACSKRREEYFQRANRIIATYATVTAYSDHGQKVVEAAAAAGTIGDSTPMRLVFGDHTFQTSYKMFR